jgi:hypothetical protein
VAPAASISDLSRHEKIFLEAVSFQEDSQRAGSRVTDLATA